MTICYQSKNTVVTHWLSAGGSSYVSDKENGSTVDGDSSMPTHDGTSNTMVGNGGNGYARITLVSKK